MSITAFIILVVGASVLGAIGLVALLRRVQGEHPLIQGTTDIEGFYITVLGALYAIFVAFMIFVVWTGFEAAHNAVDSEADELVNLYRSTRALPAPLRDGFARACRSYATEMTTIEWPTMNRNQEPRLQLESVERMWRLIYVMTPANVPDDVIRSAVVESVNDLNDLRRYRLLQARSSLPGILYAVLFFGGILTLGFASLFTSDKFWAHALKVVVLASMITFMLVTVWALDHPFRGDVHVSPEPFRWALEVMG